MAFPPKCQRLLVDLSLSRPARFRHPKFAWLLGEARGNAPLRLAWWAISFRQDRHARTPAMPGPMLFEPIKLRDITLKNRIVVPPMHQYSAVKGFATDWHLMNAGKFAAGGAGLVVVESTKVERRGCSTLGDLGIWDDAFVEPLGRLVKFIHEQGAVAGIQLGHSGRKARATRPWEGGGALHENPGVD